MKLSKKQVGNFQFFYRAGAGEPSSDEQAMAEVLEKKAYRKIRAGFDVEPGERWLDLGANIGAFAAYCRSRDAGQIVCFEPEPENFKILAKNAGLKAQLFNMAVTGQKAETVTFRKSANPQNHYRGTTFPVQGYVDLPPVRNLWAGKLREMYPEGFDGCKIDIEGSEGMILDEWLLPKTRKLVLEYHTSRDPLVNHLQFRLNQLRRHFKYVKYPKAYDDAIAGESGTYRPRFDQLIFAWEP